MILDESEVRDVPHMFPVLGSHLQFTGAKWSVWSDTVDIAGDVVVRDVLRHPGAVAVAAMDNAGRVLLIRQYRHPVGAYMWEIPAGLLDVADEDPLECAKRELLEEAGVTATQWDPLFELALSPGGTSERIRIFRAQGLTVDAQARPETGEAEERDLPQLWVPLPEAVDAVLAGHVSNATAAAAVLALAAREVRSGAGAHVRGNGGTGEEGGAIGPAGGEGGAIGPAGGEGGARGPAGGEGGAGAEGDASGRASREGDARGPAGVAGGADGPASGTGQGAVTGGE